MDEPTAAISVRQVAEVLNLIRHLRDQGIAVILISHRMPDVFAVADRIVVLRRGNKVADKPIAPSSPEEVTGLDYRRDRAGMTPAAPATAKNDHGNHYTSLDDTINRQTYGAARLAGHPPDLLGVHRGRPRLHLPHVRDRRRSSRPATSSTSSATSLSSAIIALGMTVVIITGGIDLSVGSVLCLCGMVAGMMMAADWSTSDRRSPAGLAAALARRRLQRRADRLSRHAAVRGDAGHDVDRPQSRDGDVQQHGGVPVRSRPRRSSARRWLDAQLVRRIAVGGSRCAWRHSAWMATHVDIPNPRSSSASWR